MSSKLLLGFCPENGKGKLTLATRSVFQFSFYQATFECCRGGEQVEWKPSCVRGKGSEIGQGLPSVCPMTMDSLSGPLWPLCRERAACSPVLPTLLPYSMLAAKRVTRGGEGGLGCISQPPKHPLLMTPSCSRRGHDV